MNSLMQQLYQVPSFRQGVLAAPVPKSGELRRESLLYQMQALFGALQGSLKRYVEMADFCRTVRDAEGRPVNTAQQMDANEFFSTLPPPPTLRPLPFLFLLLLLTCVPADTLFDRLEGLLKGTPQETLLKDLFGGTLSNQLIPKVLFLHICFQYPLWSDGRFCRSAATAPSAKSPSTPSRSVRSLPV